MSTTIIYRAGVKLDQGQALIQIASRDNNLVPLSGRHSAGLSLETIKTLDLARPEEAAQFFERLAQDYDGCGIREGVINGKSGVLNGYAAYRLWAGRFRKATGITLRDPRLDEVCYYGIPAYLFKDPHPRIQIKAGQTLSVAEADMLVRREITLVVKVAPGIRRRLGFISQGNVCTYQARSTRRGHQVTGPVIAAESYDSWAGKPGIEFAEPLVADADQSDPTAWFVAVPSRGKRSYLDLELVLNYHPYHWTKLAGFTDQAVAQRAADIITSVLPHTRATVVPYASLPADYIERKAA